MPALTKRSATRRRAASRGQNLMEFALTFPLILVIMLFIVEVSRAWFTYEAAKMAALEGVRTASTHHRAQTGRDQMMQRLAVAGLTCTTCVLEQRLGEHAYQANVTVTFTPLFAGLSIPTPGGLTPIIPAAFPVSYTAVTDAAVY